MPETSFGTLLRQYRIAANLTQEELAERAGVSTRGISDLERGARGVPRKDTLELLLAALDLAPTDRAALVKASRRSPVEPRRSGEGSFRALPVPPTPLVGRESDITALGALVADPNVRLITLIGPGGTGKTRLALAVTELSGALFPDGLYIVPLAPIRDPGLVGSAIAQQIGVREETGRTLSVQLTAQLAGKRALLVLDNFEHLLAAAPLVADQLAATPSVKVLATSREPLHLRGEREFAVQPLALPHFQQLPDPDDLARYAAVRLFVARAQDVKSGFALTHENAAAVVEICHRLDGLPHALELAAARIKILSPTALQARLDHRLQLLTGGAQDLPDRQRTLRNTIAWSFDLLSGEEQALFRRLAVFVGGFTLVAAATIAGVDEVDVLEPLASLIDKNLLRQEATDDSDPRFAMLETVAEFGREQLEIDEGSRQVQATHAAYFAAFVDALRPRIDGPEQVNVIAQLAADQDNIRAALSWAIAQQDATTALRLTANLWKFWLVRGLFREGRHWLERSLALPGVVPPATKIDALYGAGSFARLQGDYDRAMAHGEAGLVLARSSHDALHAARSFYLLGRTAQDQGDLDRAEFV